MSSSTYDVTPITDFVNTTLFGVLKKISQDYSLDINELCQKYDVVMLEEKKKPKVKKQKEQNDLIPMQEFMYEETKYLVDKKNNVYTYNVEKAIKIGQKLINGTVKFNKTYLSHQQATLPQ